MSRPHFEPAWAATGNPDRPVSSPLRCHGFPGSGLRVLKNVAVQPDLGTVYLVRLGIQRLEWSFKTAQQSGVGNLRTIRSAAATSGGSGNYECRRSWKASLAPRILPYARPTGCVYPATWCERRDSNSHGFPHWHLKPARLPIPPLSPPADYYTGPENVKVYLSDICTGAMPHPRELPRCSHRQVPGAGTESGGQGHAASTFAIASTAKCWCFFLEVRHPWPCVRRSIGLLVISS